MMKVDDLSVCIGCGCNDLKACPGRCSWLRVERAIRLGVCSGCPQHLARWDAGDRAPSAAARAAAMEDSDDDDGDRCTHGVDFGEDCPGCEQELHPDDPELVLPGDEAYEATLGYLRDRR